MRARSTDGVPSSGCAAVRSGTLISRVSLSSTCDAVPSTEMRSWILPGGTSKVTRDGPRPATRRPPPAGAGAVDASATSGTLPRNDGEPSGAIAISDTRAGSSRGRSPGDFGSGSQTNVTRVLPFSPRDMPTHERTTLARDGRTTALAIAASTGLGAAGLGGAVARATSSRLSAQ